MLGLEQASRALFLVSAWLLLGSPAPAFGVWQTLSCVLPDLDSTVPGVPQVREGELALEGTPPPQACPAIDWL